MTAIEITRQQFDELLGCGRLSWNDYNIFKIHWLTYQKGLVIVNDVRSDENSLGQIKVVKK